MGSPNFVLNPMISDMLPCKNSWQRLNRGASVAKQDESKVPEVTVTFWVIKVLATTLGETAGDAVTMSMNLGYLIGTAIFATIFLAFVVFQVKAAKFHPV